MLDMLETMVKVIEVAAKVLEAITYVKPWSAETEGIFTDSFPMRIGQRSAAAAVRFGCRNRYVRSKRAAKSRCHRGRFPRAKPPPRD
ncbi:hypothetical protein IFM89_011347 [Coptis chinensis]|uniref:Uncharacterized protein n=1 Tax=Coptis chinensis TaxID=261450 RepID=A0A835HJ94_9MAGN|nr:hypothetical protein IFM89_011347 [Coptis chinensis]